MSCSREVSAKQVCAPVSKLQVARREVEAANVASVGVEMIRAPTPPWSLASVQVNRRVHQAPKFSQL